MFLKHFLKCRVCSLAQAGLQGQSTSWGGRMTTAHLAAIPGAEFSLYTEKPYSSTQLSYGSRRFCNCSSCHTNKIIRQGIFIPLRKARIPLLRSVQKSICLYTRERWQHWFERETSPVTVALSTIHFLEVWMVRKNWSQVYINQSMCGKEWNV